jgi:N-methylhydantoinase A/oxoprolinase/acetone carboxylase beta subunit
VGSSELIRHVAAPRFVLSIDVGGTFTDIVAFDRDSTRPLVVHKVPTDDERPALGVLAGIRELVHDLGPGRIERVVHATTLATNALIERRGARVALVTTHGFRDVLEIGTEQMHSIYDLFAPRAAPLVPRDLRRELSERLSRDGDVLELLDDSAAGTLVEELVAAGVEAIAVCFLHSYRNPVHERRFAAIAASQAPNLPCSLSSSVASVISEYDRTSTVCVDAYIKPLISRYVAQLVEGMAALGVDAQLQLVSSSGTVLGADAAASVPVRLLESGPAAGAFAAAWFGGLSGCCDILSLDIGGTTAKACLVEHGRPVVNRTFEADRAQRMTSGSGIPIATPSVDLIEIGAGGGSIARVDELGLLKVGPTSAGSNPGPACYGRGGSQPTVTDADLVVGLIDAERFLGGRMPLDVDRATEAIGKHLSEPLGISILRSAWGVRAVVDQSMTRAARTHALERHRDPRSLALVALGGAGPTHAASVAAALGMRGVIIPVHAGVGSALGALTTPVGIALVRTHIVTLESCVFGEVFDIYSELSEEAHGLAGAESCALFATADVRFTGQFHDLRVGLGWPPSVEWLSAIERGYREAYATLYGRAVESLPIEIVNWHLEATVEQPTLRLGEPACEWSAKEAMLEERDVFLTDPASGPTRARVFDRARLPPGAGFIGPALIIESATTTVVPTAWSVTVDDHRNLVLRSGSVAA